MFQIVSILEKCCAGEKSAALAGVKGGERLVEPTFARLNRGSAKGGKR